MYVVKWKAVAFEEVGDVAQYLEEGVVGTSFVGGA